MTKVRWSRSATVVLLGATLLVPTGACSGGGDAGEEVTADGGSSGAASSDDNSRELAAGSDGGASAADEIVASSAEQWQEKWAASGATAEAPDVSDVDFDSEVAVALFAGERPSGGWKIDPAVKVKRQGTFAAISYEIVGPGDGCSSSQSLTSPYLALAVKGERLRFESTERTEPCE